MNRAKNKKKIINDPVYGFINIKFDLIYDLIEHPYFQRLRRIKQLGLTNYVYPGATHTRFQHALGAMHLMSQAIELLRSKGNQISLEEELAVSAAILLHDIGHGPFSHALENTIIEGVDHETLSLMIMEDLNTLFKGELDATITIYKNQYEKKYLHELVSGQLDMDRLDYLKRDSFFTGVYEGVIGEDRIIKMLNLHNGQLVSEHKGIYSLERFLTARRLMYWQVYFHKAVIASEKLLENLLLRAKDLARQGEDLFATPAFRFFLYNSGFDMDDQKTRQVVLQNFLQLDDTDIFTSAKAWANHDDKILSVLSKNMLNRKLGNVEIFDHGKSVDIRKLEDDTMEKFDLTNRDMLKYFINKEHITNHTYDTDTENIRVLMNNGMVQDLNMVSDVINLSGLTKLTEKYFVCYPKEINKI